ncbi:MAG: ADP-glyceromanno-heptose 6-epimerase [Bdellovibrionales bacterium]|nr:ADP-glyceromanno-heptose 6-epimerase [Bdellovibrionales bacterium]
MLKDKHILITGAAGFIGWRFTKMAARLGAHAIAVDSLPHFLSHAEHLPWPDGVAMLEREEISDWLAARPKVDAIVHLGACTDTMLTDRETFRHLNLEASKTLWRFATEKQIPFVYASSAATYGAMESGFSDEPRLIPSLEPLNPYGESKQQFDLWVLEQLHLGSTPPVWSGFKFFNVYGFGERHKGRMASVFLHAFDQIRQTGKVRLFESERTDILHGEQKRDFIHVGDAVSVLRFALETPIRQGIYNLGTGQARTFNDLAAVAFRALGVPSSIEYFQMPRSLSERYQYFTQADLSRLHSVGYKSAFQSLEEGGGRYMRQLLHFAETGTAPELFD